MIFPHSMLATILMAATAAENASPGLCISEDQEIISGVAEEAVHL